jgi:hypothetical protein
VSTATFFCSYEPDAARIDRPAQEFSRDALFERPPPLFHCG